MQLLIGERAFLTRFAFPNNRCLVPAMRRQMSIQTIFREIEFAADKPFRERRFPFEHFSPALLPQKFARLARPEFIRMLDRLAVHSPILGDTLDPRLLREFLRRFEDALLLQERFNVLVVDLHEAEVRLTIVRDALNGKLRLFCASFSIFSWRV